MILKITFLILASLNLIVGILNRIANYGNSKRLDDINNKL